MTYDPGPELDARIIEHLFSGVPIGEKRLLWRVPNEALPWYTGAPAIHLRTPCRPMHFSTDIAACARAEIEIIKRGLLEEYAGTVMNILRVSCYGTGIGDYAWAEVGEIGQVLTASPFVRTLAMLRAAGVIT